MELLYQNLLKDESIQTILNNLAPGEIINLSNVNNSFKEVLTGLIATQQRSWILYVTATDYQAQNTARHLPRKFSGSRCFTARPNRFMIILPMSTARKSIAAAGRLRATVVTSASRSSDGGGNAVKETAACRIALLAVEENWDPVILTNRLFELGYEPVSQVEARGGNYAHRGGIIDVFSGCWSGSCRIDF